MGFLCPAEGYTSLNHKTQAGDTEIWKQIFKKQTIK